MTSSTTLIYWWYRLMPYTAFARSEMQHYASWNHYLASINTNFSRQLNLNNSCHITCLMLASQQVNLGLIPWLPPLHNSVSRRLTVMANMYNSPCSSVTAKAMAIPPHIQTAYTGCLILEKCSSRVYPSPLLS